MDHNKHDIYTPDTPADQDKELARAEYISLDLHNKIRDAIRKFELIAQALAAGLPDATPEMVERAADDLAEMYESLAYKYPWTAIQNGPAESPYHLERFFSDQHDDETNRVNG